MGEFPYLADQRLRTLEQLTTTYRAWQTDNVPRIPDPVPYTDIVQDVTSFVEMSGQGLDGRQLMNRTLNLKWQQVPPGLFPHHGTTKSAHPRLFEITLDVTPFSRKVEQAIDDRQTNAINLLKAEELAVVRASGPRERHFDAWNRLLVGNTSQFGLAWDGQNFFDTDHPGPNGTTQSNLEAGLYPLNETNLDAALQKMTQYLRQDGSEYDNTVTASSDMMPESNRNERQVGAPSFHLFVGTNLQSTARELARVSLENPTKFGGMFTFSVAKAINRSATPNAWFIWFRHGVLRPLMYVTWPSWDGSQVNLDQKLFEFYRHEQWGFTYGEWWLMFMARNT